MKDLICDASCSAKRQRALGLITAITVVHFWLTAPAPQAVTTAEAALATEGAIALGHSDSKKMGILLQQVNQELHGEPLPVLPDNIPGLQAMLLGLPSLNSQLEHLVWSLALNPEAEPTDQQALCSAIALGQFDTAAHPNTGLLSSPQAQQVQWLPQPKR